MLTKFVENLSREEELPLSSFIILSNIISILMKEKYKNNEEIIEFLDDSSQNLLNK